MNSVSLQDYQGTPIAEGFEKAAREGLIPLLRPVTRVTEGKVQRFQQIYYVRPKDFDSFKSTEHAAEFLVKTAEAYLYFADELRNLSRYNEELAREVFNAMKKAGDKHIKVGKTILKVDKWIGGREANLSDFLETLRWKMQRRGIDEISWKGLEQTYAEIVHSLEHSGLSIIKRGEESPLRLKATSAIVPHNWSAKLDNVTTAMRKLMEHASGRVAELFAQRGEVLMPGVSADEITALHERGAKYGFTPKEINRAWDYMREKTALSPASITKHLKRFIEEGAKARIAGKRKVLEKIIDKHAGEGLLKEEEEKKELLPEKVPEERLLAGARILRERIKEEERMRKKVEPPPRREVKLVVEARPKDKNPYRKGTTRAFIWDLAVQGMGTTGIVSRVEKKFGLPSRQAKARVRSVLRRMKREAEQLPLVKEEPKKKPEAVPVVTVTGPTQEVSVAKLLKKISKKEQKAISPQVIKDAMKELKAGTYRPITIEEGKVTGGLHRLVAAHKLGLKKIKAYVY